MKTARIGIIGVGPRGLTVLERIVANERVRKSADLQIDLYDPNPPGVGCHDPEQDDSLLVNTVAGQITLFSDKSVVGVGPILEGPSFHEWLEDDRCSRLGARRGDSPISSNGYYSRALFGRYLHWVYHYLIALAPAHVKINLVRDAVLRVEHLADDSWLLSTKTGSISVDYLFLTSGHTKHASHVPSPQVGSSTGPQTVLVSDPYPVRQQLSFITPEMTVGIEGMGLTTFDILGALTTGRGGSFIDSPNGEKRYVASGREPRLLAYSRSGLPLTARAVNQKGVSIQYRARFLSAEKIRALRATRKLDFQADVFPLLLADMQFAYYEAYLRERRDPVAAMLFSNQFVCADVAEREELIERYVPAPDRFSWDRLIDPIPESALATHVSFHNWLLEHLRLDLAEAKRGNVDGPLKAACDVVRDLRDNLRAAVDFGGLTEASHRWLLREFSPIMNRIAVGPPASRIAELLALVDAGVLDIGFGPGAASKDAGPGEKRRVASAKWPERSVEIDVLVNARVSMHSPAEDASPLLRSLLDGGHVRLYYNGGFHPGGIEVTPTFNWVSARGQAIENAWALGIPTEGVKFYTFVVPRPGVNSTAVVDAGRAVTKMFSMITGQITALPAEAFETPAPTSAYASAFASLYGAFS
jgi:uncharacterized NAD(P)/FAD-binding protein YdhS